MKPIVVDQGKLFTEVKLKVNGESVLLSRVVIDTAAPITTFNKAKITQAKVDAISVGPLKMIDFEGTLEDSEFDGVLGLDFLKKTGAKINLDSMTISSSRT
ncbi:hypothetical protein FLK61_31695 [Paenalkalicoccus suaedae]|uniref:Aspartyl protease n=1 Tax=Paenalkalicoccus suaedae TaxID=2592382 RepID=A0A859FGE8_9BACI|nr:hypothetical protein [Paenalkalicoccus suaedae]QKS71275.1 hypothetical protein FLK61_31695 [Paenalkalicoccus suaedae]